MNPTIQSGMHPDADMLTAFAEQLMPAEEREQILAHMATCSRCREVMFLALHAAGNEAVTAPAGASELAKKTRGGWLVDWRWALIPAGALAMLIGIAAVLHFRRLETETQMARYTSSGEALQQASAPTASNALASPQPKAVDKAMAPAERDQALAEQKEERKALDDEKQVAGREASAVSRLGAARSSNAIAPGVVGGSAGAMTARGKDSSYGGPIANQLQQNANQQNAVQQQNQLQSAQSLNETAANKPAASGSGAAAGAASETVMVQAEAVAPASPAPKSAPAPAPQVAYVPMKGKSLDLSGATIAGLKKAAKISLPGGVEPLSSASAAGRTIAIDTSGALFLSLDNGKNWQSVTTQWTGRAVQVRNSLGNSIADVRTDAAKVDELRASPPVRFELVTDKLQTWISADGKTWTLEIPPSK